MSRYIDADELLKEASKDGAYGYVSAEQIADFPTADVAEVKHGRWEWNKRLGKWYCSNCDRIMTPYIVEKSEGEYEMAQPNYCGWCGSRMDGEENG